MTWAPDDDGLDAVARTLEPYEAPRERAEQLRTSVLAGAAAQQQRGRRSVAPFAMAGIAIAAAAAVVLWIATRPVAMGPRQVITPIGVARFEHASEWPDYVVHLDDGRINVQVATLAAGERFRVTTLDAEVEVRGTRFEVDAEHDRLMIVLVKEGHVEVRPRDQQVVILSAGESWTATKTAQQDIVAPPAAPIAMRDTPATTQPVAATSPVAPTPAKTSQPSARVAGQNPTMPQVADAMPEASKPALEKPAPVTPPPAIVTPAAANPGEAEFRAGWAALRAGDASAAAKAFSTACSEAVHGALGEDACFWVGAAAKRAGDPAMARTALEQFLKAFPSSARAAEAAALLGWLLYDAGELDRAERLFHQAESDRVPKVRESAQHGLAAIQHKRTP